MHVNVVRDCLSENTYTCILHETYRVPKIKIDLYQYWRYALYALMPIGIRKYLSIIILCII